MKAFVVKGDLNNLNRPMRLSSLLSLNTLHLKRDSYNEIFLILEANSTLSVIDDLTNVGFEKTSVKFSLKKNSFLKYHFSDDKEFNFPNSSVEKKLHIICRGEGATAVLQFSWLGSSSNNLKFTSIQEHKAPKTRSDLVIKTVLLDQAKFFSENLIKIYKKAQNTKASEENKNLILSDQARAVSVPKLEIEANDVSCKHGSATSRLSKEHMFLLQSRGINIESAQKLLIESFLKFE